MPACASQHQTLDGHIHFLVYNYEIQIPGR